MTSISEKDFKRFVQAGQRDQMDPSLKASARRPEALSRRADHSPKPWRRGKAVDLISEKSWQQQVKDLARLLGWKTYHTLYSKGSDPDFPDLVMARRRQISRQATIQVRWRAPLSDLHETRLIVAELKVEDKNPTLGQLEWLDYFNEIGAETYVWRPSDLEQMQKVLR